MYEEVLWCCVVRRVEVFLPRIKPFDRLMDAVYELSVRFVDGVGEALASFVPDFVAATPRAKKALAVAAVGDLVTALIPEPFDAPIDAAVSAKLEELVPEAKKRLDMFVRVVEDIPVLEILPMYTAAIVSALGEG